MKIGIYGGAFSPPHTGHLRLAEEAVSQLGLELLFVVPTGIPPHKKFPAGTPAPEIRLQMIIAAFECIPKAAVLDHEILKRDASYTIDTAKKIKRDYTDAELFLITGSDMFLTLKEWRDSETLLKLVTPAVYSRGTEGGGAIAEYARSLYNQYGAVTETVTGDIVDISSSRLREMLPLRGGKGYIDDTTYAYIIRNRLYGAKPDWDWLRDRAHAMLELKRVAHVNGCEEEAVRLARRWGCSADDAREAAVLHDITKRLDYSENVEVLRQHGEKACAPGRAGEKLLHAQTGSILARSLFGASDEVVSAIRWHTTGRADMLPLEKVIYLADYIEPNRVFDGVENMRRMAYNDIDKALIMGLEMSIDDMISRGITPDRSTDDALEFLSRDKAAHLEGKNE